MQPSSRSLVAAGVAFLFTGIASAQQEPTDQMPGQPEFGIPNQVPFASHSITAGVGLAELDGKLVGLGPDYRATFEADSVQFLPALPTAERLFPMTMQVTGYGRGVAEIAPGAAKLEADGTTALYRREGFVESYEMRQDGMKQSFTFHSLPAGNGDLVVSMNLDTDLGAQVAGNGMQFLHGDMGITMGEVVGIDANGNRTTGSMVYEGGSLEMRLPASFVSNAALPLVLDPLVGTEFAVATVFDDSDLDVAYDETNNLYCVTWRRRFSATSYGLRGARVTDTGSSLGVFGIATVAGFSTPRVCNVATENCFLAVYSFNSNILGRALQLTPTSVSIGLEGVILDTADSLGSPDVGGESAADDEGICVWANFTTGEIAAKQVNVNGFVTPPTITPFSAVVVVGDSIATYSNSAPRISNSGGSTGNHCIVWMRQFTTAPETTIRAAIVNRNLGVLEDFIALSNSPDGDSDLPAVDGDGLNWIVAWENEATVGSGDNNVQARPVGLNPLAVAPNQGFILGPTVDVESGVNDDERAVNVTWMGDSVLVCYEDETLTSSDYDIFVQPVDLFTGVDCDPRSLVASAGGDQGPVRAASKATGGGTADDALIVWSLRDLTTGDNEGLARRYRADDGINVNLGGGCGAEGSNYADCAIAGNNLFRARLRGSIASSMSFWVVSPSRFDFACGACTLIPDPWTGFTVAATTDARGDTSIGVAIPSGTALVGATFIHQWVTLQPGTPACTTFGADLSDALETEIQ